MGRALGAWWREASAPFVNGAKACKFYQNRPYTYIPGMLSPRTLGHAENLASALASTAHGLVSKPDTYIY